MSSIRRLAAGERPDRRSAHLQFLGRARLGRRLLQRFERELQLLDAGGPLGGRSEPLAPQPGDLQLQPLDLDVQDAPRGAGLIRLRFCCQSRAALGQDHRVRAAARSEGSGSGVLVTPAVNHTGR